MYQFSFFGLNFASSSPWAYLMFMFFIFSFFLYFFFQRRGEEEKANHFGWAMVIFFAIWGLLMLKEKGMF